MLLLISENLNRFIFFICGNFCIMISYLFAIYKYHSKFFQVNKSLKYIIISGILLAFGEAVIETMLIIPDIIKKGIYREGTEMIILLCIVILVEGFWIKSILNKVPISSVILLTTCIRALLYIINLLSGLFISYIFMITKDTSFFIKLVLNLVIVICSLLILEFVFYILSKIKIIEHFRNILKYPKTCYIFSILIIVAKLVVFNIINSLIQVLGNHVGYLFRITFIILAFIVIFILLYIVIIDLRRKQSELIIKQQRDYMKRLEDLQTELRTIHHDHKNIASGLYLEAQNGNLEEVKEYVNKRLLKLDKNIDLNICQMNQLVNINNIELKSLLFTKIDKASRENVLLDIEVLNPISKIGMDSDDLLRCVGILLDNAIEEAIITEEKKVVCSILKESGKITILIKNSLKNQVNIGNIYRKDFSTKEKGRGIGLYSLKQITQKYKNIFLKTESNSKWFTQILTIS